MNNQETCPKCGAESSVDGIGFACGTWQFESLAGVEKTEIGDRCYERQIAQQAAEIERLRQALKNIADAGGTTDDESGLSHNGSWCAEQARTALEVK